VRVRAPGDQAEPDRFDDRVDAQDPFVHVETLTTPVNVTDPADVAVWKSSGGSGTRRSPGRPPSSSSPKPAAGGEHITERMRNLPDEQQAIAYVHLF
jgi:hypothetical protein